MRKKRRKMDQMLRVGSIAFDGFGIMVGQVEYDVGRITRFFGGLSKMRPRTCEPRTCAACLNQQIWNIQLLCHLRPYQIGGLVIIMIGNPRLPAF